MIPLWMHLKVNDGRVNFGFWLPLFLIWILLLPLVIILIPLVLIAEVVLTLTGTGISPVRILAAVAVLLSSMRGTNVKFHNNTENKHVIFTIF